MGFTPEIAIWPIPCWKRPWKTRPWPDGIPSIDKKGVARLHRALGLGKAPFTAYYNLAYGRACDELSGPDFKTLVLAISAKPGGHLVAMEILSMRIHSDGSNKRASVPEVADAGSALLKMYSFQRTGNRHQREDYELGVIVRTSLTGKDGKPILRQLCRGLLAAVGLIGEFTRHHK